jgi:secondary thiamine-phosphate synthase enzyme
MKTASAKKTLAISQIRPKAAALQMYLETICYKTRERLELINITKDLNEVVRKHGLKAGFILVQSLHTTTAIFINEFQQALLDDIKSFLERLVGRIDYWRHNDPKLSECNRQNADSHLRAMILGHTLSVPVRDGELALGYWQSIILAELDGPRDRSIQVQVLGVSEDSK